MKLLVIGHKEHGKDTACEYIRDRYGLTFQSSSVFCAERVVRPWLEKQHNITYGTLEECFEDRVNHRAKWFQAICEYNVSNPARLCQEIFGAYDMYCGLRNVVELNALRKCGAFDVCVWIDASRRKPAESIESCTVSPGDADVIINNNESKEIMYQCIDQLFGHSSTSSCTSTSSSSSSSCATKSSCPSSQGSSTRSSSKN